MKYIHLPVKKTFLVLITVIAGVFGLSPVLRAINIILDKNSSQSQKLLPYEISLGNKGGKHKHYEVLAGGCSCTCFMRGTLVAVAQMGRAIVARAMETFKPGENVLAMAWGRKKRRLVELEIGRRFEHQTSEGEGEDMPFVELTTESGFSIVSTASHHYIINAKNEVLAARDMVKGMRIFVVDGRGGKWEKVINVKKFRRPETVFNLSLKGEPHNFLVSMDGRRFALVHNCLVISCKDP